VTLARDFARSVRTVEPAHSRVPGEAGDMALRCAAATVLTAGDVLTRVRANDSGQGVGLRGGTFRISSAPQAVQVDLDAVRWSEDLPVSGQIQWRGDRAPVIAQLRWSESGPCGHGDLEVRWPQDVADAQAAVSGHIDGASVDAVLPAP